MMIEANGYIRKEGAPSWMWAIQIEEDWYCGEILTTSTGFMTADDAQEDLMQFQEEINDNSFTILDWKDAVDENRNWKPHTVVITESGDWGYYAFIVLNGPITCHAQTHFCQDKDELIDRMTKLVTNGFNVVEFYEE